LRAANEDMAMLVPNARFFIANEVGTTSTKTNLHW
jgi:hypothetical protein